MARTPFWRGVGDRITTLRRRWPSWCQRYWTDVLWYLLLAMIAVAVGGALLTAPGCAGPTIRMPSGASHMLPGGDPGGALGSIVARLVWAIPFLALGVIGVWVAAFWQPWLPFAAAIGATVGLLGLIVVVWLTSYLQAYGVYLLIAGVVLGVWMLWPAAVAWRKRTKFRVAVDAIKRGRPGPGMKLLTRHGIWCENGGDEVRIGRLGRKVAVKIGSRAAEESTP